MSQNGGNMFPAKAEKPEVLYEVKAQRGGFDKPDTLRCKGWKQETILRMLENNMENAEIPEMLVIYGGNGKCARNWESYYATRLWSSSPACPGPCSRPTTWPPAL